MFSRCRHDNGKMAIAKTSASSVEPLRLTLPHVTHFYSEYLVISLSGGGNQAIRLSEKYSWPALSGILFT